MGDWASDMDRAMDEHPEWFGDHLSSAAARAARGDELWCKAPLTHEHNATCYRSAATTEEAKVPILNEYMFAGALMIAFAAFFIFVVPNAETKRRQRRDSRRRNQARPWLDRRD